MISKKPTSSSTHLERNLIRVTFVEFTEYDFSKYCSDFEKINLIIDLSRIKPGDTLEDLFCKTFSNKERLFIRAKVKYRKPTLSELIDYYESYE